MIELTTMTDRELLAYTKSVSFNQGGMEEFSRCSVEFHARATKVINSIKDLWSNNSTIEVLEHVEAHGMAFSKYKITLSPSGTSIWIEIRAYKSTIKIGAKINAFSSANCAKNNHIGYLNVFDLNDARKVFTFPVDELMAA